MEETNNPPVGDVEDQLANWIRQESESAEQAAQAGQPVARKKRRSKISEQLSTDYKPLAVEGLTRIASLLGVYAATRAGEKWLLSDDEAKAFGEAADKVAVKYLPMLSGYAEETALALILISYLVIRIDVTDNRGNDDSGQRINDSGAG